MDSSSIAGNDRNAGAVFGTVGGIDDTYFILSGGNADQDDNVFFCFHERSVCGWLSASKLIYIMKNTSMMLLNPLEAEGGEYYAMIAFTLLL